MSLALASSWIREGADRLADAAVAAAELGFHGVHASRPPRDVKGAKATLERLDLAIAAVATEPVRDLGGIESAVERAAAAAAVLRRPLILLDASELPAPGNVTPDRHVEAFCRAVDAALHVWPGLAIAVAHGRGEGRLLGLREAGWVLDDFAGKPVGLWLAAGGGPATGGAPPLAWADAHGARTLGIVLRGAAGDAPAEGDGLDWGTLRDLVPARAPRVLEATPDVSAVRVVESRRFLEGVAGY